MGEKYLFEVFLEKEVIDLQKAILRGGINGLLLAFEVWLHNNGVLDEDGASKLKDFHNGNI